MFNSARLSLARRRRKLTKKTLAEFLSVDQKTILRYESGESEPPPASVAAIAKVLGFPQQFFFGSEMDEPRVEAASFRSLSSMPARERDAALAAGALAFLLSDWVDEKFSLPTHDLIDCKEWLSPGVAARTLREKWGLGERPIRNMVHLLEAKGVRVFSLVENTKTVDAFSLWRRDTPYVFLNTCKTPERSRFDAAHELGHLVLHKHGGPEGGRVAEDEANQFASAFLMPEADVKARLPIVNSLNKIIESKKHWRVSVAALNYRLHKLEITTEWQYRSFCIQLMEQFRNAEPFGIEREVSQLWDKVFTKLRTEGVNKYHIAEELCIDVSELDNMVFGLTTMQSIKGAGMASGRSRAKLAVVPDAAGKPHTAQSGSIF